MDPLQVLQVIGGPLLGFFTGLLGSRVQAQKNRSDAIDQAVEAAIAATKQANEDTRALVQLYREQLDRHSTRIQELESAGEAGRQRVRELEAAQELSKERISSLETQDVERLVRITALEQQNREQQRTIDGLANDVTVLRGREARLLQVIGRLINHIRENGIELPPDLDVSDLQEPMKRNRGRGGVGPGTEPGPR